MRKLFTLVFVTAIGVSCANKSKDVQPVASGIQQQKETQSFLDHSAIIPDGGLTLQIRAFSRETSTSEGSSWKQVPLYVRAGYHFQTNFPCNPNSDGHCTTLNTQTGLSKASDLAMNISVPYLFNSLVLVDIAFYRSSNQELARVELDRQRLGFADCAKQHLPNNCNFIKFLSGVDTPSKDFDPEFYCLNLVITEDNSVPPKFSKSCGEAKNIEI